MPTVTVDRQERVEGFIQCHIVQSDRDAPFDFTSRDQIQTVLFSDQTQHHRQRCVAHRERDHFIGLLRRTELNLGRPFRLGKRQQCLAFCGTFPQQGNEWSQRGLRRRFVESDVTYAGHRSTAR